MRLGSLVVVINEEESSSRQFLMATSSSSSADRKFKTDNNKRGSLLFAPIKTSPIVDDDSVFADYCGEYPPADVRCSDDVTSIAGDKQRLAAAAVEENDGKWSSATGNGNAGGGGGKRQVHRLVYKNGECNVTRANIKKRRQRYMADIFTTLVDIKWRWNLFNFVLAFILSWLIFALAWWLICFSHGDFQQSTEDPKDRKPCVEDVYDFTTALLFSIETQQTIGFGSRRTTPHCPEAILVMMCQSCFGVIVQALMTGLVFAKLSRPKKRAETLLFSKNALVCRRDGQLCLLFRVGDMRKSHIVEAHVRAILIKRRTTLEGEVVPLYQYDLKLGDGETEGRLFMVWPVIVEHRITRDSPLWELSAEDLLHKEQQFELVVVLEGIVESTGMTTQARTSYLPGEIVWGHRFEKLVTFRRESGQYLIDYSRFHSTVAVDMPHCSARDMEEMVQSSESTSDDGDDGEPDDETMSVRSDPVFTTTATHPAATAADVVGRRRRLSIPALTRTNGVNGVALAAFDLQNEEPNFKGIIDCSNGLVTSAGDTYQFM